MPAPVVMAKSPAFVPVITGAEANVTGAVPTCTIVYMAVVVDPTGSLPKLSDVGLKANVPLIPVPLRATVCGEPVALSVNVTAAVRVPEAVGVNVTYT